MDELEIMNKIIELLKPLEKSMQARILRTVLMWYSLEGCEIAFTDSKEED